MSNDLALDPDGTLTLEQWRRARANPPPAPPRRRGDAELDHPARPAARTPRSEERTRAEEAPPDAT